MKKALLVTGICVFALIASGQSGYSTTELIRKTDRSNGIFSSTDLNYAFGLGTTAVDYSKYFYGLSTVTGYQFGRIMKLGLGLGASSFNAGWLFPAYLHTRLSLPIDFFVPFIYLDGGYLFSFTDITGRSRPFVDAGAGLHMTLREGLAVNISGGLFRHYGGPETKSTLVNFRAGLEFKARQGASVH